jgi:LysM repeat protein
MIGAAMAARKPGRYLAPIAILAIGAVIALVVKAHIHTTSHSSTAHQSTSSLVNTTRGQRRSSHHRPATYTVKSGDSLSVISAKTGIPMSAILRLNHGLNPNALQPGQVLRLRR